jgi:hypothetical protein
MRNIGSRFLYLAACATLAGSSALAQTPSPAPTPTTPLDSVPEKIAPGAKPTGPTQNLSDKLNQSNGVIHPKEVDPAIDRPAPKVLDPNVIPPPGTSGDTPAPQPK